jgi:hypothetical protein
MSEVVKRLAALRDQSEGEIKKALRAAICKIERQNKQIHRLRKKLKDQK